MIIYFSGTGNSRFAAKFLAKRLGDDLWDAGRQMKAGERPVLYSDHPWVFIAPVYAWRMPKVFADYIREAKLSGSKNAYFVLTCGGDIGNAGKYAFQICREKGLHYHGVLEVLMPENYIAMFKAPGLAEARAIVTQAKPVLESGVELIQQGKIFPPRKINVLDSLKSSVINEGFYNFFVKANAFYGTDACTGCGICLKACPLNNIALSNNRPVWGKNCTHCMACICGCPSEAIEYGKRSREKIRYQCPRDEYL